MIKSFKTLLNQGTGYQGLEFQISGMNSRGAAELFDKLVDTNTYVPERLDKLSVYILGCDGEEVVWNKGNNSRRFIADVGRLFEKEGKMHMYHELKRLFNLNKKHIYRDEKRNRHNHGNDRPSFFGLGFQTMTEMRESVSKEEYDAYLKEHQDCCGAPDRYE